MNTKALAAVAAVVAVLSIACAPVSAEDFDEALADGDISFLEDGATVEINSTETDPDSLRFHAPVDEKSGGNISDIAGGRNGELVKDPNLSVSGIAGTAIKFNGSNYVDWGSNPWNTSENWTTSLWVKLPSADTSTKYVFDERDSNKKGHALWFDGGDIIWRISDGTNDHDLTTTSLADGNWQHISLTYNDGDAKLYHNGSQVDSFSATGDFEAEDHGGWNVRSAGTDDGFSGGKSYTGFIDEFRQYEEPLNSSQISDLYNNPTTIVAPTKVLTGEVWTKSKHVTETGESWINFTKLENATVTAKTQYHGGDRWINDSTISFTEPGNYSVAFTETGVDYRVYLLFQANNTNATALSDFWGLALASQDISVDAALDNVTATTAGINGVVGAVSMRAQVSAAKIAAPAARSMYQASVSVPELGYDGRVQTSEVEAAENALTDTCRSDTVALLNNRLDSPTDEGDVFEINVGHHARYLELEHNNENYTDVAVGSTKPGSVDKTLNVDGYAAENSAGAVATMCESIDADGVDAAGLAKLAARYSGDATGSLKTSIKEALQP